MELLHEMFTSQDAEAVFAASLCYATLAMLLLVVVLSVVGCRISADINKVRPTPKRFLKTFVACYEESFGTFAFLAGMILSVVNLGSASPHSYPVIMGRIVMSIALALLGGYLVRCGFKRAKELLRFQTTLPAQRLIRLDRVVSLDHGK